VGIKKIQAEITLPGITTNQKTKLLKCKSLLRANTKFNYEIVPKYATNVIICVDLLEKKSQKASFFDENHKKDV